MGTTDILDTIRKHGSGIAAVHTVESVKNISREEACRIWRFAESGYLQTGCPVSDAFVEHFNKLGGFSPEISKRIGWES